MQRVFVQSIDKKPLMPCAPARARKLLSSGRARVVRRYPFTIQLEQATTNNTQPVRLKLDPGSKTTGISLVALFENGFRVVWAANLSHRGHTVKKNLDSRRGYRRGRRSRNLRYRKSRFLNRGGDKSGWLPPSLMSRVHNVETWSKRLKSFSLITAVDVETVRFDTQLMQNPDIQGVEYQRGELVDWELRQYLLYRHKHTCAYCGGLSNDPILEREHIHPRSKGGSNRLSNQVIACHTCNDTKGNLLPEQWLSLLNTSSKKIDRVRADNFKQIVAGQRPSLRDTGAVNATRYKIGDVLKSHFDQVEFWSGGRTKKNRSDQGYRKDHWIDAACVGTSGGSVFIPESLTPLLIKAQGHGSRQFTKPNASGFPRTSAKARSPFVRGFKTGDLVKASVPTGLKAGIHVGRVAVRKTGSFNISTNTSTVQGISHRYCEKIHCADGYNYNFGGALPPHG